MLGQESRFVRWWLGSKRAHVIVSTTAVGAALFFVSVHYFLELQKLTVARFMLSLIVSILGGRAFAELMWLRFRKNHDRLMRLKEGQRQK